jgi:hypothetical protein
VSSSNVISATKTRLPVLEELRQQLEAELGPETGRGILHALELKYGVRSRAVTRLSMIRKLRHP